jgi:hypothetical protein
VPLSLGSSSSAVSLAQNTQPTANWLLKWPANLDLHLATLFLDQLYDYTL